MDDEGIEVQKLNSQDSKIFSKPMTDLKDDTEKKVEKFVNNIEKNILNFPQ